MGNQPLGDNEPQMPQHGNVTAQFLSAQHSEKSFQRKMEFLVCKGEYKVQIEFKRLHTPFRVISIQAKLLRVHVTGITEQLPESQNSELLRQHWTGESSQI